MAKIIAISNLKGGVGKTATAINLSSAIASFNHKVLLVDLDPTSNASKGLGFDVSLLNKSVFDLFVSDVPVNKLIKKTNIPNLDLLPSKLLIPTETFAHSEDQLIFKKAIHTISSNYDYIIIDCPPSYGYLSISALASADSIIVPVQCEYFAMDAISSMLAVIANIKQTYNPNLQIEGFLLTLYDSKTSLGTEISTQVRSLFKENTFLSQIPKNISIAESNAKGLPVTIFRPNSSSALAYFSLAKEILDRN